MGVFTVNTQRGKHILAQALEHASGVKYGSFVQPACVMQRIEKGGGGGNNDSVLTALRPQLCNRHSIKTHSGYTDRKQIELMGEHFTLYQTDTQDGTHREHQKKSSQRFALFTLLKYFRKVF